MSYTVAFSLSFQARMSEAQVRWLREELALTFHSNPTLDPAFPRAFGLLDRFSGLFLIEGEDDAWNLECRTYREPVPWQLAAWNAQAKWVLDALPPDSGR